MEAKTNKGAIMVCVHCMDFVVLVGIIGIYLVFNLPMQ